MQNHTKFWLLIIICLGLIGIGISGYLTYEHFRGTLPTCKISYLPFLDNCGQVLGSKYAQIGPLPTAMLGLFYYIFIFISTNYLLIFPQKLTPHIKTIYLLIDSVAALISIILVYLQLFVLHAICPYCMLSAFTTFAIFFTTLKIRRLPTQPA